MIFNLIYTLVVILLIYSVIPNLSIRVLKRGAIWRGAGDDPVVALTFDDGPDPDYTPRLLDALKESDVVATFFVIASKAVLSPEIMQRMIREGHDVQVHGHRHSFVPLLGPFATWVQVVGAARLLQSRFGVATTLYRPTWGLCNILTFLLTRSHRLVTWSIMVGDWRVTPVETLLGRITARLHPGAVIVLHDSDETWGAERGAPESVIAMIPKLAKAVRQNGYSFEKLVDWQRVRHQ